MAQFDHDSKWQTAAGMAFAIYLAFVVNTVPSQLAALVAVIASGGILANGGILVHRKWNEYKHAEDDSMIAEKPSWENPSLNVTDNSRTLVGFTAAVAYGLPALAVIIYSSYRLFMG